MPSTPSHSGSPVALGDWQRQVGALPEPCVHYCSHQTLDRLLIVPRSGRVAMEMVKKSLGRAIFRVIYHLVGRAFFDHHAVLHE